MFEQKIAPLNSEENEQKPKIEKNDTIGKYKNIIQPYQPNNSNANENTYQNIDSLLEREKQHNKTETWNKLDKTIKIQKLHQYAEKYGRDHSLPMKDIKLLKTFFLECMEKNKLQKTKEVSYDKVTKEVAAVPALFFHSQTRHFTLKNMDSKRVSTIKSLTPKRIKESIEKLNNDEVHPTCSI
jgi:hypothetical protein